MKLKISITLERTYEPLSEFYSDPNPESILKEDIKSYQEDPAYMLEFKDTTLSVKGEVIEP